MKTTPCVLFLLLLCASAYGQGAAPETAAPLFPKGALLSYGSYFDNREFSNQPNEVDSPGHPTFSHSGVFVFTWGFYPNFDFTFSTPIVTNRFGSHNELAGSGIGDAMLLIKYRFYRSDSERGTNQMSLTAGPKLPTGSTGERDSAGTLLPASLQPGSGSTDIHIGLNWTYTGLFGFRRLVADENFHFLRRFEGTQQTRLGSEAESRFWLSYRPYESKDVRREWFIGPTITWVYSGDQEITGITQATGGSQLLVGVTTYIGLSPGLHVWFAYDKAAAQSGGALFTPLQNRVSFGITKQFRFF